MYSVFLVLQKTTLQEGEGEMVIQLAMVSIFVRLGAKKKHFCEVTSQQTSSELEALFNSPTPFNVHHYLSTQ